MNSLLQDLRYGARMLSKNPGFTLIAIITLALGIGANTAIFSVVNGVLLTPLPYREPEQLIRVFERSRTQPKYPLSGGNFQDYRDQNSTLSGLALYTRRDLELSQDDKPERLAALLVTAGFFELLGVQPMLGREFRREDELPENNQVVILSHRLWQRRFNSDPGIVGRVVTFVGAAFHDRRSDASRSSTRRRRFPLYATRRECGCLVAGGVTSTGRTQVSFPQRRRTLETRRLSRTSRS